MNQALRRLVALIAFIMSLSVQAAVTASLDRDHIAVGEAVRLLLQRDGSTDDEPDIGPLRRDFDVLGSSKGSRVQIINGHASSQTEINLVLAPKHDGLIHLPSLQWAGEMTPALEVVVGGHATGPSAPAAESSHVFLTATLDQNHVYVQAAVVLTVKLYSSEPLHEASLELPANSDVLIKQIGDDKQISESRNGDDYQVIERHYVLIPQRSGPIRLAGPILNAKLVAKQANDPFGNDPAFANIFGRWRLPSFPGFVTATRPFHLRAKSIELNVQPRPAGSAGSHWLPAQSLSLEESWRPETTSIHTGEPLTRHLRLTAHGLTGGQLPDLNTLLLAPDGIKLYPDQPQTEDRLQGATVQGERAQDIAFIAQRPGHYTLPVVRLSWWDTVHSTQREAMLPSRQLEVLPAATGASSATTSPPAQPAPVIKPRTSAKAALPAGEHLNSTSLPWPWISLALGLLWLVTWYAKWRTTRHTTQATPTRIADDAASTALPAGSALEAFRDACRNNDAQAARRHLLEWADATWPTHSPLGLNALSQLLDNETLAEQLRQLDRACYMNAAWEGETLARSLSSPLVKKTAVGPEKDLPGLYPEP